MTSKLMILIKTVGKFGGTHVPFAASHPMSKEPPPNVAHYMCLKAFDSFIHLAHKKILSQVYLTLRRNGKIKLKTATTTTRLNRRRRNRNVCQKSTTTSVLWPHVSVRSTAVLNIDVHQLCIYASTKPQKI